MQASANRRKRVAVLGSTGSVGVQALDVIARFPDELHLVGVAAMRQVGPLRRQVERHRPAFVALERAQALDGSDLPAVAAEFGGELLVGPGSCVELVKRCQADLVLVATVGVAGLLPTIAALEAGADIALANKEVLVCAGDLVSRLAREKSAAILPVDSEHNAIYQCLQGNRRADVRRVILTASGGPFRKTPVEELAGVTREQALAHPRWNMGPKITIDSATLMNKGFEVIEARWLFGLAPEQIDAVTHPQSCVHSMVEYVDGSIIAQLGPTDMRLPIQHCLFHPERRPGPLPPLDLAALGRLDFEPVDAERFPCFRLAREAMEAGGLACAALNAANEVAVADFLAGRIGFLEIPAIVEATLAALPPRHADAPSQAIEPPALDEVLATDAWAREFASAACHPHQSQ